MVLRETSSDPGGRYQLSTQLIEVVDQIPAEVAAAFVNHDAGERVHD